MKNGFGVVRTLATAAVVVAAVAFHVSPAGAQNGGGMNLSWNDCGPAGTASKTFACTSNTLTGARLIVSAVAGIDLPLLNGEETLIVMQTNQASLSPWWHLETGGCRGPSALVSSHDFSAGPFTCIDPWAGQGIGSLAFTANDDAPNRALIHVIGSVPGTASITGTDEYDIAMITLLGDKSTGTGSCAGCTNGACIVMTSVKLTQSVGAPGGDVTLTRPLLRNYVTFQAGGTLSGNCPPVSDPVAVRRSTWGSVKSLYR